MWNFLIWLCGLIAVLVIAHFTPTKAREWLLVECAFFLFWLCVGGAFFVRAAYRWFVKGAA